MKWSDKVWLNVEPIFNKIIKHPFIIELMSGDLSKDKFIFYLQQDTLYLAEFGKVMSGIASKFDNQMYSREFINFAKDTVDIEMDLHSIFIKQFDVPKQFEASPACLLYTSYMHNCLHTKDLEIAVATVLPCFWIYKKVGDFIYKNQSTDNNPYKDWINTYSGDEFGIAVNKAIKITNELADNTTIEKQNKMIETFILSTKMEWMFWDCAYQLEKWPL